MHSIHKLLYKSGLSAGIFGRELGFETEIYDVNTPVTYERYCGAYKGAWMAFDTIPKVKSLIHNGKINGIDNLYVAGQWVMMPGGLPAACLAGKWAIQRICKDENIKFSFRY